MPLDPSSFDSDTPRTLDGREYPEHLRQFEQYDRELLPLVALLGLFEQHEFVSASGGPARQSETLRWLESAEWRGLIERRDESMASPRVMALTERGRARLAEPPGSWGS
jgi:hypothetical protein